MMMMLIYIYDFNLCICNDFLNHDSRWLESIEHKLDAWNTHEKHRFNTSEGQNTHVTEAFNSTNQCFFA